jgi:hypothetical protein
MECYLHPGTSSTATCVSCARPICYYCREDVAGHPMCKPCVAAASARLADAGTLVPASDSTPSASPPNAPTSLPSARWLAETETTAEAVSPATQPSESGGKAVRGYTAPGFVRRVGRGMGWGILYGQWWTLWSTLSLFMWGQGSFDGRIVSFILDRAILNALFGFLAGIIIGATGATMSVGTNIGIGTGIALGLLRMALSGNPLMLVNLFFYFVTGRFVGSGITWRVQQPVK